MLPYFQAEVDFVVAHWQAIIFCTIVLASVLNRVLPGHPYLSGFTRQVVSFLAATPMTGARSAIFALLASKLGDGLTSAFFDWLSKWLDIPVLSKSVHSEDPGSVTNLRGYARLEVLIAIALGCLLSFAARAEDPPRAVPVLPQVAESDPPPAPPAPQFGGCVKAGKLCFGPSVAMTVAAINLKTKTIEGAFSPGVGYGFTLNPGKWSSLGADAYFTLDPAAQKASASFLLKFFNGYARAGVSKGIIGDVAWRIPLAIGIPTPF